ncbi:MAG: histidine kinase [Xanthomonadaceae bacterium]|nr:histidine kinase [Xanthomonadaceae bacterium]MDE2178639.1 histidine kinase [Xanthomonadaceae bacterium]MDE2245206.1 histidine kinase [Xanthomonadaceae bacterium]
MTPAAARERAPLPDFCSAPVLFALLLVAAIVALVLLLAPGGALTLRGGSQAMLFAVWLALLGGVALCKLRPWLDRLPGAGSYAAAWLLLVLIVLLASVVVHWMDRALGTGLIAPSASRFVLGNAAVTALIAAALLRYLYVLVQWRARLDAVARAQVEALQARIRPHFLFNSLNTAAALVRLDPPAAERTLENLADLFRAALGADDRPGTLGEELDLIERYLAIEQLRLGARLRVERDLDALPRALPLPRLLLQPLVENAVHHGIQPRREGGLLRLGGRCVEGGVEIVIANPLSDAAGTATGSGHGLANVRARIGYHFGTRGALHVATADGRWTVTVRLPDASPDRR